MGFIFRLGCLVLGIGISLFLCLDLTIKLFALLHLFPPFEKAAFESGAAFVFWLVVQLILAQTPHTPPKPVNFSEFLLLGLSGLIFIYALLVILVWKWEK